MAAFTIAAPTTTTAHAVTFATTTIALTKGDTGAVGLVWRGAYNALTAYTIRDAVTLNGSSYYAIANSTGKDPATETTYWSVLAEKGSAGASAASAVTLVATGYTAGELDTGDTDVQKGIDGLDGKNAWEYGTNPIGTISDTANCTIDAATAAEATVTFAAAAQVTIVPSNFTAKRSSVHVILTNGGAATSIAYGAIQFANKVAPAWTVAGKDEFLLYRTSDGVINLTVGRQNIGVIP